MLVGGGVEDGDGLFLREDRVDALSVADVGDVAAAGDVGRERFQFAIDLEEVVFGLFDEHEAGRLVAQDLSAHFRAYGAAGARDQDDLVVQVLADALGVEFDLLAAEEVFDVDVANLRNLDAALDDRLHGGNGLELDVEALQLLDEPAELALGGAGFGEEDLVDAVLFTELSDPVEAAEDGHAVNLGAVARRIVVEEADDAVALDLHAEDFAQQGFARIACAGDEADLLPSGRDGPQFLVIEAYDDACTADGGDGGAPIEEKHGLWELATSRDESFAVVFVINPFDREERDDEEDRTEMRGLENGEYVAHADVAPRAAEHAHPCEHDELEQEGKRQQRQKENLEPAVEFLEVVIEAERKEEGEREEEYMREERQRCAIAQDVRFEA